MDCITSSSSNKLQQLNTQSDSKYINEVSNKEMSSLKNSKYMNLDFIERNEKFKSTFNIIKRIGKGGSSSIYVCNFKNDTKKKIVAKIIKKDSKLYRKLSKESFIKFVKNEILIQSNCRCKYTVAGLGYYIFGEDVSAIMQEYAPNGSILHLYENELKKLKIFNNQIRNINCFSESLTCYISFAIVSALKHLYHLDVLHQDIKLDNVVVDERLIVKLTDFSISVKNNFNDFIYKFSRNGTSGYISPENISCQYVPIREVYKSDYFSLGVVIFQMIFGYLPFNIDFNDSLDVQLEKMMKNKLEFDQKLDISEDLKDFLKGVLEFDYKKRFNIETILTHPWMKKCKLINSTKEKYMDLHKFLIDLNNDTIFT